MSPTYEAVQDSTDQTKRLQLFAENIRTLKYDPDGNVSQIISANRMTQYQSDTFIKIIQPEVEIRSNTLPIWKVTAKTGTYERTGSLILNQNVEIKQLNSSEIIDLKTDDLLFDENTGFVSTEQPVTMTSKHSILTATGMSLDTNQEIINFSSDVNAVYEPE